MGSEIEFFERLNGREGIDAFLNALKWDEAGRVTVVSQDAESLEVLGVAFADRTALQRTLETGLMHYYSRSRSKLWLKGEQSGHFQHLVELRADCDGTRYWRSCDRSKATATSDLNRASRTRSKKTQRANGRCAKRA